ncbi:hypothetical protein B0J14DRAFT_642887 [Halenospora varia]|nr:hypothetical protein B0J14DRAFT_642887 [Halenospora varia]
MQYSTSFFALAAFVSAASAQVFGFDTITAPGKTTGTTSLTGGQDFEIKWEPNTVTGTVTVSYYQGTATNTLELGGVVKANVTNQDGKVAWTVPSAGFATYGIKITLDSDTTGVTFQWSDPFTITGGSSSSSSATGSSTSSGSKTSTVTGKTTSSAAPTSANSTSSAVSSTITSSSLVIKNATTTASTSPTGGASNSSVTLLTTLTPSATTGGSSGSATSTATKGPSTTGAAVANIASGSLALIGGFMAVAFAL